MRVGRKEQVAVRILSLWTTGKHDRRGEEMYGMAQQEVWRQRPEEIRQQVAALRLEKSLRVNREGGSGLWRDLSWEMARFAGLLNKRLRRSV
jgi:hypothetical protein